jgi:hypothetical protein
VFDAHAMPRAVFGVAFRTRAWQADSEFYFCAR